MWFKCENIQHGAIAGAPPIAGAEKFVKKIFCHKFFFLKKIVVFKKIFCHGKKHFPKKNYVTLEGPNKNGNIY